MKPITLLCPILLVVGCATESAMTPEQRFKRADANGSGSITRSEATKLMIAEAFEMYDSDGSGEVSEAEYLASGGTKEGFQKINSSNSGRISLSEAQASPLVFNTFVVGFDEADTDKNGEVTLSEYLSYLALRDQAVR